MILLPYIKNGGASRPKMSVPLHRIGSQTISMRRRVCLRSRACNPRSREEMALDRRWRGMERKAPGRATAHPNENS